MKRTLPRTGVTARDRAEEALRSARASVDAAVAARDESQHALTQAKLTPTDLPLDASTFTRYMDEFPNLLWARVNQQLERTGAEASDASMTKALDTLANMWVSRSNKIFNRVDYCGVLEDYVGDYACKGEISSKEAINFWYKLVRNTNVHGDTPFQRLAVMFNLHVLKQHEVTAQEAAFHVTGETHCHTTFCVVRASTNQTMLDTDPDSSEVVKEN